jgi:DNA-directed RNA polymerase specialized sigma24 family protein
MTSAGEVFVIQLARASKRANLFLRARGLRSHDRDDVIATAILWCWEHRANYSLTTTLDTWFMNAIKEAHRNWARGAGFNSVEQLSDIPTGDATLAAAEAKSAATALIRALPTEYKCVAKLLELGYSREEMMAAGLSHDTIYQARQRIRQLRRLLPDAHEYRRTLRAAPAPSTDETGTLSWIDKEIEALDFPPPHGKDCPPCWRCKWFEGYLPGSHVQVRMPITEPEVAKAVSDTEAEKIRIAKEVRDGNL